MNLLDHAGLRRRGVPYGKVQLWRLERKGKFPKRVALSASRVAWVESEIDDWIKARVAGRGVQVVGCDHQLGNPDQPVTSQRSEAAVRQRDPPRLLRRKHSTP